MAKKPKKPKLTKEEKALRKEQAKQRKEEAKKQERRDHLERELVLAEQSWQKLKKQFKEMLLKMQMPTIKHDIEVLWHSYDAALDRKDFVIEKLLDELDERDLLRQHCLAEHAASLSNIISLKDQRAREAQKTYEREREEALVQHEEDKAELTGERSNQRMHFQLVTNAMNARNEDQMINMRSEYVLRLDDERDKMNDARKLLKGILENRLDDAWRHLRGTLATYESSATERRKRLNAMASQDARSTAVLERQEQRVQQLQSMEEHLRWCLSHEEPAQMLRGRIGEQRYFYAAYCALRMRLDADRKRDERQLSFLVAVSNEALEKLRRLVKKAQRLLGVASGCHHSETQEERIVVIPPLNRELVPVGAAAFAAAWRTPLPRIALARGAYEEEEEGEEEEEELEALQECESSQESASQSLTTSLDGDEGDPRVAKSQTASLMLGFWRRVARADVRRADLLATVQALRFEQASLRRALRCCLRDVEALRPREVDRRQCAESCYGGNRASMDSIVPYRRNVVEAAHVYKNLPC